jgi:hypothetical protein
MAWVRGRTIPTERPPLVDDDDDDDDDDNNNNNLYSALTFLLENLAAQRPITEWAQVNKHKTQKAKAIHIKWIIIIQSMRIKIMIIK